MTAFSVYAERREQEVMDETWGHLRGEKDRSYTGFIVFAAQTYGGERAILADEFDGLDGSPWRYEQVWDFVWSQEVEDGKLYRFDGTYRDGKYEGTVAELLTWERTS